MGKKKDLGYYDAETQTYILNLAREIAKDAIEKKLDQTWIVVEWGYKYSNGYPDVKTGTLKIKYARKLYCPETGEYKELP